MITQQKAFCVNRESKKNIYINYTTKLYERRMDILQHVCRMIEDPDYRSGFVYALNRDYIFDVLSSDDLIQLCVIYHSFESSNADGIAWYCWEIVCRKEGINSDPHMATANAYVATTRIH